MSDGSPISGELVLASANLHKVEELERLIADWPVRVLTMADLGPWPDVDETGDTYLENARLKAAAVAAATGLPALADDSGIEVDALGGGPGPRSARFAGPDASDEDNNRLLVTLLAGRPPEERTARYRCVAVVVVPRGAEAWAEATCEGRIGFEPRGSGGFGYDPWFIPRGDERTMAELTTEEKDAISHRGRALRALRHEVEVMLGQVPRLPPETPA
ncbi:MAG: RdgB/HAM1 family non-canonical purine NTP pyrophosphatase [Actinomycetota bacterium]